MRIDGATLNQYIKLLMKINNRASCLSTDIMRGCLFKSSTTVLIEWPLVFLYIKINLKNQKKR